MTLTIHDDVDQGSDEWFALRRGIVTASVVDNLIGVGARDSLTVDCHACGAATGNPCVSTARKTPTPIKTVHSDRAATAKALPPVLRIQNNDTSRGLTLSLAAERLTGFTEESYQSRDMERGQMDEPYARGVYSEAYAEADIAGFMVRDMEWQGTPFRLGYSPDGVVGDSGLIEVKSRLQKIQVRDMLAGVVPMDNMAQLQTGLLVSGREWIDYVSYCGGMHLWTKRVEPDDHWFAAITEAVGTAEVNMLAIMAEYDAVVTTNELPLTERINHFEGLNFD